MTSISFSYKSFDLQVTFPKKMGMHKKEDLEKAVKKVVDKFIAGSKEAEITGTLEVRMKGLSEARVRELGKKWTRISLGKEETPDQGALQRTMLSSEELEALETASTRIGKALSLLVDTMRSFFYFITGIPQKPSVDMALLQEVIGYFPQDGKVRVDQALDYWTRVLEKEAVPSVEAKKLNKELKECAKIQKEIVRLQSLEGRKLDKAFEHLSEHLLRSIKKLEKDQRILIPAGFWKEADGRHVFQDCLLEIRKAGDKEFTLSLFSTEEEAVKEKTVITEKTVTEEELDRNIPLILALHILPSQGGKEPRFVDVLQAIFSRKMFARLKKETVPIKQVITTTAKELQAIFGEKAGEMSGVKPSPYKSVTRLAKIFIRHEMPKTEQDLDFKIVKLRGETDLLRRATANDVWLASAEYRETVTNSAHKLLSDISGVKKGGFFEQLVEQKKVKREVLEEETTELEKILDKVSSYAKVLVKKSARETLGTAEFGSVGLSPAFIPADTKTQPVTALSGVDISPLVPASKPKNIEEAQEYLATASSFCEDLVKQGKYEILEKCVPLIYSQLSLRDYSELYVRKILRDPEATYRTHFFKNISPKQADALSLSLSTLQRSISACMLANSKHVYHSDFLLAVPFFEAMHHQVLVGGYGDKRKVPYFEGRELRKEFSSGALSYCRSPEMMRCIQEMQFYESECRFSPVANLFEDSFEEYQKGNVSILNASKAALLNRLTMGSGSHFDFFRPFGEVDLRNDELLCRQAEEEIKMHRRWVEREVVDGKRDSAKSSRKIREYPSVPQGKPMTKLPDVILTHTDVPGKYHTTIREFYCDALNMTFEEPQRTAFEFRHYATGEVNQGYRMYSPATVRGLDSALQQFAGHYRDDIDEFEFYTDEYALKKTDVKFSADEVRAIQTLSPNPNASGADEAAIASLIKLATYHPRLLSVPQVRLFIYRTILRPGVMDTEENCRKMKDGINALLGILDRLRQGVHGTSAYAEEIYLISLLGTLSARIPESTKEEFPLASKNWVEEMNEMRRDTKLKLSTTMRHLLHQEYLGLILANGMVRPTLNSSEISDIFSAWVGVNIPGAFAHSDPGIQKEAQTLILSLLPCLQKMTNEEKAEILNRCVPGLPQGGWDFTEFPSCKNGDTVVQLDTGALWEGGKLSGRLSSEIEGNPFFEKVGIEKKQIWNVSQTVDEKTKIPIFIYSSDRSPFRILCSPDGVNFSIQKKIKEAWYTAADPRLENVTEEARQRAGKRKEQKNEITLPLSLYPLSQGKVVYVEAAAPPTKMILDGEDGPVVAALSADGKITEAHSDWAKYGVLGPEGTRLFAALDNRIIAKGKGLEKNVSFPHLRLRGSKKKGGLVAVCSQNSWEYEDEMLKGYKVEGQRQPVSYEATLKAGALPTIPPGITSYQLLVNEKENTQKVLIPMLNLELKFSRHAPGFEPTEEKKFARFVTQVQPGVRKNPVEEVPLFCFDVENDRLISKDPLANAYLAYLYATQQRYEDAKFYLEKSHTNFPEPQLQQIYAQILTWKDDSPDFAQVRRKALLLQTEWPLQPVGKETALSKAEIAAQVIASFAQTEKSMEEYALLDEKDKIRLEFLIKGSNKEEIEKAYDKAVVPELPPSGEEGKVAIKEIEIPPSGEEGKLQETDVVVKDLLENALPLPASLPATFAEEIALRPDETIEKYFLTLSLLAQKKEDIGVLDALKKAQVRMFPGGRELARLLLEYPDKAQDIGEIIKEDFEAKASQKRRKAKSAEEIQQREQENEEREGRVKHILYSVPRPLPPVLPKKTPPQIQPKKPLIPVGEAIEMLKAKRASELAKKPAGGTEKAPLLYTPPEKEPEGVSIFSEEQPYLKGPGSTKSKPEVEAFFSGVSTETDAEKARRNLIVEDTVAYLGKEGAQQLFDPSTAPQVRTHFKTMELELQKEQEKLRNDIFTMVNKAPEAELERVKEALTPSRKYVHFERLLGGYTRNDLKALLEKYGIDVDVKKLEKDLQTYLEVSVKLNQVRDAASKIAGKTEFSEAEQRDIGASLEGKRFFTVDTSSRSRVLLMLEYSCGFLLREGNIKLVDRMLKEPNCVAQLPPGAGKTLVVLRLLAIMRANGANLSTLILPEWLEEQNVRDLDRGVKELIGQDIFCLKVPPTGDLSYVELHEIHERLLATMQNRSVLATTRTDLLTLRNSFQHLGKQMRTQVDTEDPNVEATRQAYAEMGAIIALLQKNAWALTDEVDSILDIHREVNRKEGGGEILPPWQRDTGFKLASLLLDAQGKETPLGQLSNAILHNTHVDLPSEVVKKALEEWAEALLEDCKVTENRDQIKHYLLQTGRPVPDLPEPIDPKLKETLVAAKSFLSQALPLSTLTKADNVKDGYGRFEGRVIPFAGPDQPEEQSEYCNPFEMIAFTIQDYLYRGVTRDEAFLFANNVIRKVNQEWHQAGAIPGKKKECEASKQARANYGIDIEKLEGMEEEDQLVTYVTDCINKDPKYRLNFCRDFALSNIRTTEKQSRSDNFDLVDMTALFSGMTGTPTNVDTFHDRISKKDATTPGSDGKALAAIMEHAKDIKIFKMPLLKGQSVSAWLAKTGASSEYQGIIDIGANCKEKSPEALAIEVAGYLPKEDTKTRYIIYVDRKGQIVAYDRKNKTTLPFDEKSMSIDERKTIYQVFVGVDIKQAPKAKFLLTVGNLNFLKDFIQGALRLRALNLEQSFDIALSPEVEATIRSLVNKPEKELTIQDILTYYLKNEVGSVQGDTLAAEKEKIARVPRAAIFKAMVRIAGSEKTAQEIAKIEEQLEPWTRQEPAYTVEALASVQREEDTATTLKNLKKNTLEQLEKILMLEVVANTPELRQEIEKARDELKARVGTDSSRMPPKNKVGAGSEEMGKTATAVQLQQQQQQQQTMQLTEAVAYAKREVVPSAKVPRWHSIIKTDAGPLRPEDDVFTETEEEFLQRSKGLYEVIPEELWQPDKEWKCFDQSILISKNIHKGFASNMFKDLSFAVYDTSAGSLIVLDKADLSEVLAQQRNKRLENFVPMVIGQDISILKKEDQLPKDKERFYQQIVQVKLMAGFIDFTSKEEKEALQQYVDTHNRKDIEDFVESNRKRYLSETSYQLFKRGKGALAEALRMKK